jgi:fatty acid desaturase
MCNHHETFAANPPESKAHLRWRRALTALLAFGAAGIILAAVGKSAPLFLVGLALVFAAFIGHATIDDIQKRPPPDIPL